MPKKSLKLAAFFASIGSIMLLFGTSYALLESSIEMENGLYMKTEDLDVYLDNVKGKNVTLDNINPISDHEGKNQEGYNFTIANNGNTSNDYIIFLDNTEIKNEKSRQFDKNIKYQLSNYKITKTSRLSKTGEDPYRILDTGSIKPGESITYKLRVWLDIDTIKEDIDKVFSTKIRVKAVKSIDNQEKKQVLSIGEKESKSYNKLLMERLLKDNVLKEYKSYEEDLTISLLIQNIDKNIKIETSAGKENIKNLIEKSNIIILSLGKKELEISSLFDKNLYQNITNLTAIVDEITNKISLVIEKIRLINKDATIILLGEYNKKQNDLSYLEYNEIFDIIYNYFNDKYYEVCRVFNCFYVERFNLFKEDESSIKENSNLTNKAMEKIKDAVIEIIYS